MRGIPSRPVGGRARAPGMAMTASTPPAKLLHSNRRLPRKMEAATSQQMTAVSARAGVARYLCRRHCPSDSPDTMVSRAVPSCTELIGAANDPLVFTITEMATRHRRTGPVRDYFTPK